MYAVLASGTGSLVSPDYNYTQSDYCLNFWYFLEGDRGTQLRAQRVDMHSNTPTVTVWADTAELNIRGQWLHSRASFTQFSSGDYNVSRMFCVLLSLL